MPKILIVEDEPSIADNIRMALDLEGFQHRWASTLAQADEYLAENTINLIILDIGLPDGNGFDFCRKLRASQNIPVIMLTARSDEVDRIVGLEIGADDYVTKPFSPRELSARIKSVLRRTQNSFEIESPKQAEGKLKVDSNTFSASYEDQKAHFIRSRISFNRSSCISAWSCFQPSSIIRTCLARPQLRHGTHCRCPRQKPACQTQKNHWQRPHHHPPWLRLLA
ncbi:response regulator [Lentisphaera araneosa HTCC2155]|uniref:Response regulator n=1 Tax=Lentisphaera araneosa HTCC2155 TaxID=313628 RepID=A6DKJ7_9BACT|nr:response regulator [Lentisphaera araneosa]EDM27895.1 response regulator [Lentisphaera araneosa HTCC2155]